MTRVGYLIAAAFLAGACKGDTAGEAAGTGTINGWVCLGPHATPSAGAKVTAHGEAGTRVVGGTERDGSFSLAGVPAGAVTVVLTNRVRQEVVTVSLRSGAVAEVGSPCHYDAGEIHLRLCIDGTEDPEVATTVRFEYLDYGGPKIQTFSASSDEHGLLEVHGLAPGTYRISVEGLDPVELVVDPGEVETHQDPGCYDPTTVGTVSGRVCNPIDGTPVESIPVDLEIEGEDTRSTSTDAQGRFRFDAVPPGSHTLWIRPPLQAATDIPITVEAGDTTSIPSACEADPMGSVSGTVCDPTGGAPLAGAAVRLDIAGEPARVQTTNPRGYFYFGDVPEGTHAMTLPAP